MYDPSSNCEPSSVDRLHVTFVAQKLFSDCEWLFCQRLNPIALRKAQIVHNFGICECYKFKVSSFFGVNNVSPVILLVVYCLFFS